MMNWITAGDAVPSSVWPRPVPRPALWRERQQIGVIVDVKTAGFARADDVVVELAARRFAYNQAHVITWTGVTKVWREDPEHALPDEFVEQEGLNNAALSGCKIDREEAATLISSADICIAHSARFDRPLIEKMLPSINGLSWICSAEDIDWGDCGCAASTLQAICHHLGIDVDHRSVAPSVDAVLQILQAKFGPDRSVLSMLVNNARQETWRVSAFDAPTGAAHALQARGYHWDPARQTWWREVRERACEEAWLTFTIYSGAHDFQGSHAVFERLDWRNRYARR